MEEMERMMRNKMNQAKQLVYQQHLEMDGREEDGLQGFGLNPGEDLDDEKSDSNNFNSSDLDYARFLRDNEDRNGPVLGQKERKAGQDGQQAVTDGSEVFDEDESGSGSLGK